jgi:multiple sugar transport system permease protein
MTDAEDYPIVKTAGTRHREVPKHLFIWCILAIELLPFYMMVQISFKNNLVFNANPWFPVLPDATVIDNFRFAIHLILPYIANTLFVAVTSTCCNLLIAILAAYFFARYKMPFANMLWSAFIVLMLIPSVANIVPLFSIVKNLNLLNTLSGLIAVAVAGGQVFNIFVLRNFIEDLPRDLFEAAEMDGAGHFRQVFTIVIPLSGPIIGTLFILSFLGCWNDFLLPLTFLRDQHLFTLGVGLIYLDGEYVKEWGHIMAAFMTASIPLLLIFLFTMKLFIRGLSAGALKG